MRTLKKWKVVGGLTGLMMIGGIAFAAWTANGTGSGYAKATNAQALTTLDVSASTVADLYPGQTNGDLLVRISNPNPYPVQITSISQDTGSIETVSNDTTCEAATGVSLDSASSLTWAVPASSAATHTLADAVNMTNASDNACQGETFIIPVTFSGASNA